MSATLLQVVSLGLILLGVSLCMIRLLLGPSTLDRLVAADTLAVITTAGLVGLAAWLNNPVYLDIALVFGALAFVGTVAIARSMEQAE
ncbi:MAG: monovalent cation/H+ antiporter complex subunit F [Gammaproteobacteria bacterium]|nr:monovalent cation/H+ antiporter complex subunit F [Gammaproteobacteria bacterium]